MGNSIAKADEQSVLASYSREQVDLIKSQVAPSATDDELKLFLYVAKQRGLDPLAKQIYCIHRGGKMTLQTSIDGFRSIAERTGTYAPGSETWADDDHGRPVSATVSVRKLVAGTWIEFSATAHTAEYNAGGSMWGKMTHVMVAKCAEAKVLRKGWPELLGGLYTQDEMDQADRFGALAQEAKPSPEFVAQNQHAAQQQQNAQPKPALIEAPKKKLLPPLPDRITTIPAEILSFIAPLRPLGDAKLQSMSLDALELVIEQMQLFRSKVKSADGKQWLMAIEAEASHLRGELEAAVGPEYSEDGATI